MTRTASISSPTPKAGTTLTFYDYALDGVGNRNSAVENGSDAVSWALDCVNQLCGDYGFSSVGRLSWMRLILVQGDVLTLTD